MLTNNFIFIASKFNENEYTEFKFLTVLKVARSKPSGQKTTKLKYV